MEGPQEDLNKSLEKGSCKFPSVHVRVTLLPPLQRQPADYPPRVMDPSPEMRGSRWTREIFRETGALLSEPSCPIRKCNET